MERYENYLFNQPFELDTINNRRFYQSLLDPVIERDATDIYVITSLGERLDKLAWKYYSDASLWWIIAASNPNIRKDSLYLEPGIQVRIPRDYQKVLTELKLQNESR